MIEANNNQWRYYGLLGTMAVLLFGALGVAMGLTHMRRAAELAGNDKGVNAGPARQINIDGHIRSLVVLAIPLNHQATARDALLESNSILNGFMAKAGAPPWSVRTRETHAGHTFFINRDLWTNWPTPSFVLMAATAQSHHVSMLIYHGHMPILPQDNALFQKLTYKLAADGATTAK